MIILFNSRLFYFSFFRMLEHELTASRTNETTAVLRKVQESGVKLFYHLVEFYTEEAALCPPTKQLITTCLEKLGQVHIKFKICDICPQKKIINILSYLYIYFYNLMK